MARIEIEPEPPPPQHNLSIPEIDPEPPPSLPPEEYNPTPEETQWIEDAQYSATQEMARVRMCNDTHNQSVSYTPFI